MKKLVTIVSVLLLVLGLSQCRKPVLWNYDYKTVTFTTDNGGGEKGYFINNGGLKYKWSSDDKIYVYGSPADCVDNTTDFSSGEFCGVLDFVSATGDYSATFKSTKIRLKNSMKTFRFVHYGSGVTVDATTGSATVSYTPQEGSDLTKLSKNVVALCDAPINNECVYENCKLKVQFAIAYFSFVNFFDSGSKEDPTSETFLLSGDNLNSTINVSAGGEISYIYVNPMTLNNVSKDGGYYVALLPEEKGGSEGTTQIVIRGHGKKTTRSIKIGPNKFYCGNAESGTPYTIEDIEPDNYSYGTGSAEAFTPGSWNPLNP